MAKIEKLVKLEILLVKATPAPQLDALGQAGIQHYGDSKSSTLVQLTKLVMIIQLFISVYEDKSLLVAKAPTSCCSFEKAAGVEKIRYT